MSDLEHRVFACIAWLPLPVAAPLRAAEVHEHEPAARLEHLAHAAEALMQFVGSVVVADGAVESNALKLLAGTRSHAAMGIWRSAIEQITPSLKTPTVPDLRDLLKRKADSQRLLAALTTLAEARNALAHPIRRLTAELAGQHTPKLLRALDACLELLSFFSKFAMLRIDRVDDTDGRLIVTPLVGAESLRKSVALRWPQPPPVGALVLVSAEPVSRWLELNPLYRLDGDRRVLAYGRQHDNAVEHFDVCQPDRVDTQNVSVPNWLHWRLTDNPPRRGESPLGAEGHRLANLGATAAFASSGPWPTGGDSDSARTALAMPPFPALPEPLNIKVAPFPGLPPPRPYALSKRQQVAVTLVSAVLGAGALTWVTRAMRTTAPQSASAETAERPAAPASDAAPGTPTSAISVANAAPPVMLLQKMNEAQNVPDIERLRTGFLDPLDCYFNAEPDMPKRANLRTLAFRFRGITGRTYRVIDATRVLAVRPEATGTPGEALVCEFFSEMVRGTTTLHQRGVRYLGLRQTDDGWRVFAEGGPLGDGSDSRCTRWLSERFSDAKWQVTHSKNEKLSSFGETPCGTVARPMP